MTFIPLDGDDIRGRALPSTRSRRSRPRRRSARRRRHRAWRAPRVRRTSAASRTAPCAQQHRGDHARQLDVDAAHAAAVELRYGIEPIDRFADHLPVLDLQVNVRDVLLDAVDELNVRSVRTPRDGALVQRWDPARADDRAGAARLDRNAPPRAGSARSISRATAPAARGATTLSCCRAAGDLDVDLLVGVVVRAARFRVLSIFSTRGSTSSSSATSAACDVVVPCPISTRSSVKMIVLSGDAATRWAGTRRCAGDGADRAAGQLNAHVEASTEQPAATPSERAAHHFFSASAARCTACECADTKPPLALSDSALSMSLPVGADSRRKSDCAHDLPRLAVTALRHVRRATPLALVRACEPSIVGIDLLELADRHHAMSAALARRWYVYAP